MAIPQVKSLPGCCHQVHRFRFLSQGKVTPWTARTRPAPAELHWGLQEALDARDLSFGVPVHALLVKAPAHFAGSLSLWNKLLNLYGRCGQNRTTMRLLFDEMRERDVVTFNTMISSCLRSGDNREVARAVELYSLMRGGGIKPNNITLSMLLAASSCSPAPLCLVEQIHAQSVKMELAGDGFVGSALVSGYSRFHSLEQANRVFDRMDQVDAVGWNILIDSCARSGTAERTVEIFSRMRRQDGENETIDGFSLTSVLKTCSEPKYLRLGTQIHACAFKAGFSSETPIGNALITMYSKCQKCKESMAAVFQTIPQPNIISWTAMISGLMQIERHEEAISFYMDMLRMGFAENEFSFASVLPAFSGLASLQNGRQIHGRVAKSAHGIDVAVGNALVDMYFKCGSLEDGQRVFRTMKNHDVVSWTAMIGGLGQHGKAREALEVLQEMVAGGYKPDSVTFLAGLSACSHGGLVNDGFKIFHSMTSIYRIKPMKEHYASLIDLLGRAGKLEDAARFIAEMGLDSDPLAWETLLGACRIHGDTPLGEISAKKIMELEPQKEGAYVMLSNIYAEKRMWEQKGILRHTLDATGLKKDVGYSWSTVVESYTT
ncbi:unnamed protein product [Spirodela intermedia]|uniref:Uncharacterized protein n=1 Tax=Spirodela intermedia TaxID=51605 RepID=A0A7I8KXP6_SPIIN|nr:unnamed protein product [Spirodela intermedia]